MNSLNKILLIKDDKKLVKTIKDVLTDAKYLSLAISRVQNLRFCTRATKSNISD